jgi:hypothetical protein
VILDDPPAGQLFSWSSASDAQMLADVQFWLEDPASNFGWLIKGDESAAMTVKRLNSGESAVPPALEITYVPEPASILLLATACAAVLAAARGTWRWPVNAA